MVQSADAAAVKKGGGGVRSRRTTVLTAGRPTRRTVTRQEGEPSSDPDRNDDANDDDANDDDDKHDDDKHDDDKHDDDKHDDDKHDDDKHDDDKHEAKGGEMVSERLSSGKESTEKQDVKQRRGRLEGRRRPRANRRSDPSGAAAAHDDDDDDAEAAAQSRETQGSLPSALPTQEGVGAHGRRSTDKATTTTVTASKITAVEARRIRKEDAFDDDVDDLEDDDDDEIIETVSARPMELTHVAMERLGLAMAEPASMQDEMEKQRNELTQDLQQREGRKTRASRRRLGLLAAVVLVLIVAAATLGAILGGQGLRNSRTITEIVTPPTPAPTVLTRQVQLRRVLRAAGANLGFSPNHDDDEEDDNDDNDRPTAQEQAFQWLAHADNFTGYNLDLAEDAALQQNLTNLDLKNIVHRYALAVFYYSTGGPQWKQSFQFLSSTSVCDWSGPGAKGVGCLEDYPRLPAILSLGDNGLTGTLPRELELLQELRALVVSNNQLQGTLPTELGSMTDLLVISAPDNDLTGPIPTQLRQVEKLHSVLLQHNELTGTIPAFFWFLPSIVRLRLEGNHFVGSFGPLEQTQCGTPYTFEDLRTDCFQDEDSARAEVTCPCCSSCCQDVEEQSDCLLQNFGNG